MQATATGSRTRAAYATGLTLFTLERIRFPTDHPAYRRAAEFLLRTQCADGSWHVRTRSKPVQTYFDNGDPHGAEILRTGYRLKGRVLRPAMVRVTRES